MANTSYVNDVNHITQYTDGNQALETTVWKDFLKLIKVGIVNSNLITTFTGIWLALYFTGESFWGHIGIVLTAMVGSALILAGSCSLNNFIDRDIDHLMERTKSRPTVTGKANPIGVLMMGLSFVVIGTLLLFITSVSAAVIGLVGVFTYVVIYSMWTKRQYAVNTIVGSVSGAVPPLIGWAAIDPNLSFIAWMLFIIMFIWQPPHFLALAMRRSDEYRKAGIPMMPVVQGFAMTKRQIIVWVACLLPLPFYLHSLGIPFMIIATALNIGWLYTGIRGYKNKNDFKWATKMFVYSLNYLTILFVAMIVVTFFN